MDIINVAIKQLEEALKEKEDSKLRVRCEILLDVLKEFKPIEKPKPAPRPVAQAPITGQINQPAIDDKGVEKQNQSYKEMMKAKGL